MGLTTEGLTTPTLTELRQSMRAHARAELGPEVALGHDGPLGQMLDAVSLEHHPLYELAAELWNALHPDASRGLSLDNVAALVGVVREPATKSTGTVTLGGDVGTPIPAGSVCRVPNGPRFLTTADATIGVGGTVDVNIEAEETGPIEAGPGAITERVTAITGWDSVTNAAEVDPGQDIETDAELRARREASLQIVGSGTDGAIRSRLEQLEEVQAAIVISNRGWTVDANGIPGKAFMAVVWPNTITKATVAKAIWATMPAGIEAYGVEQADITDSQGYTQQVGFSFADELEVHLEAVVTTVAAKYPADGDQQIEDALLDAFEDLSIGEDVILLQGICEAAKVEGVLTLELRAKVGSAPGPGDTSNLAVALTEIARFDAARITVTSS